MKVVGVELQRKSLFAKKPDTEKLYAGGLTWVPPELANAASPKPSPKKSTGYERNKRWRERHPESYRAGQRELMRKRASKD